MKHSVFCVFLMAALWLPTTVFPSALPVLNGVGGDFTLESTTWSDSSLSDFRHKIVLLTFGYTNCSDVCPVTLGFLNRTLKKLGTQASQTQVLFVSLDPEYDTVDHMKSYLNYFNPSFVGLTGQRHVIDTIAKKYHIRYSKTSNLQVSTQYRKLRVPVQGESPNLHHNSHIAHENHKNSSLLYSHSTSIYLIDFQGRVRAIFGTTTAIAKVVDAVKSILEEE